MRLNIEMDMRNLINLVAQPLFEASFKWFSLAPCCANFAAKRGGAPNIAFFNDQPLKDTDKVSILIISTKKLNDFYRMAYGKGTASPEYAKWNALASFVSSIKGNRIHEILARKDMITKFPEFFKMVEVTGRERIYRYITTDLKMPVTLFVQIFGEVKEEVSSDHSERFHNALLIFPESMRDGRREVIVPLLERVFNHLKAAGLERIFKGNIRVMDRGARNLGTYVLSTGDMTLSPRGISDPNDMVYTLIHEYGHKHFYEFLTPAERDMVKNKYYELVKSGVRLTAGIQFQKEKAEKRPAVPANLFDPEKLVIYIGRNSKSLKRGDRFRVKHFDRGRDKVVLYREEDPRKFASISGPPAAFKPDKWQVEGRVEDDSKETVPDQSLTGKYVRETDKWFPTEYSMTEYEEWYAECFAFFVLKHLHGEPEKWFAKIIK